MSRTKAPMPSTARMNSWLPSPSQAMPLPEPWSVGAPAMPTAPATVRPLAPALSELVVDMAVTSPGDPVRYCTVLRRFPTMRSRCKSELHSSAWWT